MQVEPDSAPSRGRLAGKVAIVTGGGHLPEAGMGTGSAISALFAREGAAVAVVDLERSLAANTVRLIEEEGNRSLVVTADVTSSTDCATVVAETMRNFGRVDVLVNNVGVASVGGPVPLTEEEWHRVINVNLTSAFLMSKHILPVMERQGSGCVVNVSSTAAERGIGAVGYTSSKYALNSLTREIAFLHGRQGVRANSIEPGLINTPMALRGITTASLREQRREERRLACPLGTEGSAEDVAFAALFLASDEARWITGAVLPVDGGILTVSPMHPLR
jgi:NAD(P)-dependent dehydrogenase (short-subunit alcohol dehydrogenase family)